MHPDYFLYSTFEKRIETNKRNTRIINIAAAGLIFTLFIYTTCLVKYHTMIIAWGITLPLLWLLYRTELYYLKKIKEDEFRLYYAQKEHFDSLLHISEIRGDLLSDYVYEQAQELTMPEGHIIPPTNYYIILSVIDFTGFIFCISSLLR